VAKISEEKQQEKQQEILAKLKPDHDDAKKIYSSYLQSKYLERQKIVESRREYYDAQFKSLSKIPMTTSEVQDTVMWIMPALVETFSNSKDVVSIQPEGGEDQERAEKIQELLNFQTERLNDGFMNRYFWMLSCLQMNIGFIKASWDQEKTKTKSEAYMDANGLMQLPPNITVKKQELHMPGDGVYTQDVFKVSLEEEKTIRNQPRIEVLPVTEVRWNSAAKRLKDAKYVEHKTKKTLNYLYQKQKAGVYFNVDQVQEYVGKPTHDTLEQNQNGYINQVMDYGKDDLRRDIDIYECYTEYDLEGKGELKPWIFTVAGECDVLIGVQENTMGRLHPIFDLVAMPDQFNVVPNIGFVELVGEIQSINTALTRLMIKHLIKSNAGKRFVNKSTVDQDDILNEADDIGVEGDPRTAVYPMPPTNLSPMTMPFFQMQQSSLESKVGVTKYNTGTDAANLNPTATGVTALIDQANKKIKLIARVMSEYYREFYRFLISLNQQYIDEPQVIRLTNGTIEITPDDLEGKFDLIISTGLGGSNKQAEIQSTQLLMGVLEKVGMQFPGMVTPDKAFNLVKMLLEQLDKKNVEDFINDPQFAQQIQQIQAENQMLKARLMQLGDAAGAIATAGAGQAAGNPGGGGAGLPQPPMPVNPAGGIPQAGTSPAGGINPFAGIAPSR
jgi:hypothetical protein